MAEEQKTQDSFVPSDNSSARVTDPELLAKIEELSQNKQIQTEQEAKLSIVPSDNSSARVTDPDLLAKINDSILKKAKQEQGSVEESQTSLVKEGSVFEDMFETVKSVGAAVASEPAAGLYGIGTLLATGGDLERAVSAIDTARESITYTPKTVGSQANVQAIGDFVAPLAEGLETVSSVLGDTVFEVTDSPELATVFYSLPTAALEAIGFKGYRSLKYVKESDIIEAQKVALNDPELKYSGSVAEVKLNNKGQLVEDKIGKTLVKNGVSANETAVITNSTPSTKQKMSQMVKTFEQGKGNDILAMSNKTTDTIGSSVTERLSVLKSKRNSLGKRLESVVEGYIGNEAVDISNTLEDITATLNKSNVNLIIKDGKVALPKGWQKGTVFEVKQMAPAKQIIEDVITLYNIDTSLGQTTVKNAHKLKKNLDTLVSTSELSKGNPVVLDIARMRKKVNDALNPISEYSFINRQLSEIMDAMEPFNKHLKTGQNWSDAKVSAVVGNMMKNLSSESGAVGLISDLSSLERTLKSQGLFFRDDPRALIAFRKTLLDNFNIDPSVPSGDTMQSVGNLAISLSVQNTFGAAHDVKRLISSGMKKKDAQRLVKQRQKAFNTIKMAVNQKPATKPSSPIFENITFNP